MLYGLCVKVEQMTSEQRRPLMNYSGFSDRSWTVVKVPDPFPGWSWGEGEFYDWCDAHCSDQYNIVKYERNTVYGRFKSASDATMFAMRWA